MSVCFSLLNENEELHQLYEAEIIKKSEHDRVPVPLNTARAHIEENDKWFILSICGLGLFGFVQVMLNARRLRRLSELNTEQEETVLLLEQQLAEIKQAEKEKTALQGQLHQAQKLEAVGRLAGGIAHDFNNILAAMNGYAEFLVDDLDKDSPQYGFATNILKAGRQARELIDQVLAFSRRDRDETMQMDLRTPINETVSMLKASLPKSVEIVLDIQDEEYYIHGSPLTITQALMNLCVNAKDAMENEKGRLMVSLRKAELSNFPFMEVTDALPPTSHIPLIEIESIKQNHTRLTLGAYAKDHDYMCISIADDGSGISQPVMEHIFEPFFTTKDVDKGTGLGMAMVHGVMIAHRGAMVINSIVGKGTRFDLLFPIVEGVEDNQEVAPKAIEEARKLTGKILLVDDQADIRSMMEVLLKRNGFEVEICENGSVAYEVLQELPDYFDVVITDQNMPKMSGFELIRETADEHPDIPFIMLSGYALEGMRDMIKDHASVRAILNKPVNRDKLLKAIYKILEENQA